jgi:hypothetical protein
VVHESVRIRIEPDSCSDSPVRVENLKKIGDSGRIESRKLPLNRARIVFRLKVAKTFPVYKTLKFTVER